MGNVFTLFRSAQLHSCVILSVIALTYAWWVPVICDSVLHFLLHVNLPVQIPLFAPFLQCFLCRLLVKKKVSARLHSRHFYSTFVAATAFRALRRSLRRPHRRHFCCSLFVWWEKQAKSMSKRWKVLSHLRACWIKSSVSHRAQFKQQGHRTMPSADLRHRQGT